MKATSTFLLLLCSVSLCAQLYVNRGIGQDYGLFESVSGLPTAEKHEGNPYLQSDWQRVNIVTISGDEILEEKGKLDIWQHKLVVFSGEKNNTANNHLLSRLNFLNASGDTISYAKVGIDNKLRFAKFLKKGKIKLLEIPSKTFNKVSKDQDSSGYDKKPKSSFSNTRIKYYISVKDEDLIELKTSKRGFIKSFPEEYQSKISRLLKSKKPNLKEASELVAFLGQIEELL